LHFTLKTLNRAGSPRIYRRSDGEKRVAAEKLKREILELLEKDVEFRYAVAGYVGLSEILKRMDRFEENQNRLWEEVKSLREAFNKLALEQERMRRYMVKGFRELSRALGVTFEDHAAAFLEVMLQEMGYTEARVERRHLLYEGEIIEVNMFCEEPLVIGEATLSVISPEDAEKEVEKLVKRIKIIEEKYGRKPHLTVLSIARATPEAIENLKTLTEKHGIKLILGKDIEEEEPLEE